MDLKLIRSLVRQVRQWQDEIYLRRVATNCDAFLVSYPKCGRTWLRFLLSNYFADIAGRDLKPDLTTTFQMLPNFDLDPVRGLPAFALQDQWPKLPLLAVSHRTYDERLFQDRPVIFMIRDPRDVMVSAYFHAVRHKQQFNGPIGTFLNVANYGLPAFVAYLNGWALGLAHRPHIILSYERLSAETAAAVTELLMFLNIEVRPDALDKAIEAARFDQMQAMEQKEGIPGHAYDRSDIQSLRMRSGKIGQYAEYLSPEEAALIIRRCQRALVPAARELFIHSGIDLDACHIPGVVQPLRLAGGIEARG
ncbi:MAG: sulfotransferase domain-containing protein [Alphaproteobacteria bacterium]|nr:sulfotransferase domain-containing protein [Alphaproteobacteria bacterium]